MEMAATLYLFTKPTYKKLPLYDSKQKTQNDYHALPKKAAKRLRRLATKSPKPFCRLDPRLDE